MSSHRLPSAQKRAQGRTAPHQSANGENATGNGSREAGQNGHRGFEQGEGAFALHKAIR